MRTHTHTNLTKSKKGRFEIIIEFITHERKIGFIVCLVFKFFRFLMGFEKLFLCVGIFFFFFFLTLHFRDGLSKLSNEIVGLYFRKT